MKAFIEYLDYTVTGDKLYNPCGDRSTVILDGRNNLETMVQDAHNFNGFRRPEYPYFRIHKGDFHSSKVVYSNVPNNITIWEQ